MIDYSIVIPTTGRHGLGVLLRTLGSAPGPRPAEIIVVDDRPSGPPLSLPETADPTTVVCSGGRGPAAARNTGWRLAESEWIAFLDDDVVTAQDWPARLADDLEGLAADVAASQARIEVPLPAHRRPTDGERGTVALASARWITADMAYRRAALAIVDGFDERFPRAYREDADLALRVQQAGFRVVSGSRITRHPARTADVMASVRAQRGNADNGLMRHKHGTTWRRQIGEGRGRLGPHAMATAAGLASMILAASGWRRASIATAAGWAALTAEFTLRRILPGPRTPAEVGRMLLSSVLIPPAACLHRLRGELHARRRAPQSPAALLFDRDDTLIHDVPYLSDPRQVAVITGADKELQRLREAGIPVGVVSNQSGVARGVIEPDELAAVNARVEELLGPFDTWQVCVHGPDDGCVCRKPEPGLIRQAAAALGVDACRCVVIGDTEADVRAARAAGARGILVPSARTLPVEVYRARRRHCLAADLRAAVTMALDAAP